MSTYRISGLDPAPFRALFGLDAAALQAHGVQRCYVDQSPGFPDRIQLQELAIGDTALLLNYEHQPAPTPYRASHAIFISEKATHAARFDNQVPQVLRSRLISLRAFDAQHAMLDAEVVEGQQLEAQIRLFFANPNVAYLHAHNAKRGCYAALVTRGDDVTTIASGA